MTRLIEEVENGANHDAEPVKYHCRKADGEINLGTFSRKRERNADSSGTVMG